LTGDSEICIDARASVDSLGFSRKVRAPMHFQSSNLLAINARHSMPARADQSVRLANEDLPVRTS